MRNANTPAHSINVNDPTLITLVNKLQDVFTTVGVRRTSFASSLVRLAARHPDIVCHRSKIP